MSRLNGLASGKAPQGPAVGSEANKSGTSLRRCFPVAVPY